MNEDFLSRCETFDKRKAELDAEYRILRQQALEQCRRLASKFALSAEEIADSKPVPSKRASKPKYRNPSGSQTWTGTGKAPAWFKEAINMGFSQDDMLIDREKTSVPT